MAVPGARAGRLRRPEYRLHHRHHQPPHRRQHRLALLAAAGVVMALFLTTVSASPTTETSTAHCLGRTPAARAAAANRTAAYGSDAIHYRGPCSCGARR